jgi:hypothetical protein
MRAGGEETLQVLVKIPGGIGPHNADKIEAMLPRRIDQRGFDLSWIGQKSRSA